MELDLKDKVVLVTGGSKGIGLACAIGFAREGARIALTSRSEANLRAAGETLRAAELQRAAVGVGGGRQRRRPSGVDLG